jgi:hypothetical protein
MRRLAWADDRPTADVLAKAHTADDVRSPVPGPTDFVELFATLASRRFSVPSSGHRGDRQREPGTARRATMALAIVPIDGWWGQPVRAEAGQHPGRARVASVPSST